MRRRRKGLDAMTRCPHCKSDYVKPIAENKSLHSGVTRTWWVCGSCDLSFETETR